MSTRDKGGALGGADLKNVLTEKAYGRLRERIAGRLAEAKRAGRSADAGLAKAYWEIGDDVAGAGLTEGNHYGESVLERLADAVGMEAGLIRRCLAFRRIYGRDIWAHVGPNLTWSHYRLLIQVGDEAARRYYQDRAVKEGWGSPRLRAAILGKEYERVVLKEGEGPTVLRRPAGAGYVFKAEVLRVVDGDTLLMDVGCGFNVKVRQKIRLAKLDAPEMGSKKGAASLAYVRDRLAEARAVVVKTEGMDDYGRYVGHVFYSPQAEGLEAVYEKGRYLNEELLRRGLAERM